MEEDKDRVCKGWRHLPDYTVS